MYEKSISACVEDTPCSPISSYGIQKYFVEKYFSNFDNFKVIRLSYVLTREDFIFQRMNQNKRVPLFTNFLRNVVVEDDVYEVLDVYSKEFSSLPKVLNLVGPDLLSKFDIGKFYAHEKTYVLPIPELAPTVFFKNRERKIETKSVYLCEILQREPSTVRQWIQQTEDF